MSKFPESNFPPPCHPSPLGRQLQLAQTRAHEQVRPEDSASLVGSMASWSKVNGDQGGQVARGKAPPPQLRKHGVVMEQDHGDLPKVPPDVNVTLSSAPSSFFSTGPSAGFPQSSFPPPAPSPAMQAARTVLEPKARQSVKKQKARAKARGNEGIRWGPVQRTTAAQHSRNFELPRHIRQAGTGPAERSVLIIDDRDVRVQSPYAKVGSWVPC